MKIHQLLFFLLVFFLPTQLGKHFWPDWSMVRGLRVDYLAPTIYLTDILAAGVIISWGLEKIKSQKSKSKKTIKKLKISWALLLIGGLLILNSLLAANPAAAFYKLVKLTEFVLLGIYITKNRFSVNTFYLLLSTSLVYSSLLAIFQFLNQGSLGGVFYWLGERTFNAGTPGIALASWNDRLFLRPYATFSHPNAFAGFLVISLILMAKLPITNYQFFKFSKPLRTVTVFLGIIALFLTFSRASWLVFGISLAAYGVWFLRKINGRFIGRWMVLAFIGSLIFLSTIKNLQAFTTIQPESIWLRQDLNRAALEMIKKSPILGVGLGNFLVRLPEFYQEKGQVRFLQPAHNLYLLIAAEAGLFGLIGLVCFLILTIRCLRLKTNYLILMALSAILFLGLFDHYFYTLQQGQILISLVLGLSWSKIKMVK